jgi:hypothetical protein
MPIDPRKRQKKLEKRKAKQKEKKKELARRRPDDVTSLMRRAASAPILHCCVNEELWTQGMANVLVSRELPDGRVAVAMFLVDAYCLGVKNALAKVMVRTRYDSETYGPLARKYKLIKLTPECARKLVEGAVDYAQSLGFAPHEDYRPAKLIFGDIDASACGEEFTYGKDGKPFFIAGPHDSPGRVRQIMDTLSNHVGTDNYHFLLPVQPQDFGQLEFDPDEIDWDEEPYDETP